MKFASIIALGLLCCFVSGCAKKIASDPCLRMEEKAYPFYLDYFYGHPDVSLTGIRRVEQIALASSPDVWRSMDQNSYMALVHGRMSVGFARVGNTEEAKHYRALAIRDFQRRKDWNEAYQTMFPITPSPSREEAEKTLFTMLEKLDEHY
ncbi:MAG: hypothetical protein P4L61_01095 [Candidatus Pacebacteria bacterium]|nr:hypothetical protein [Candidatus Paceibacterota bacterium]